MKSILWVICIIIIITYTNTILLLHICKESHFLYLNHPLHPLLRLPFHQQSHFQLDLSNIRIKE